MRTAAFFKAYGTEEESRITGLLDYDRSTSAHVRPLLRSNPSSHSEEERRHRTVLVIMGVPVAGSPAMRQLSLTHKCLWWKNFTEIFIYFCFFNTTNCFKVTKKIKNSEGKTTGKKKKKKSHVGSKSYVHRSVWSKLALRCHVAACMPPKKQ